MTKHEETGAGDFAFDVPEIATKAKVSEAKIWAEIAADELETILIGDRRLATPEQVQRWLERKAERARQSREQRAKERDQQQSEPAE
jgi:hypothetical protein